MRQAVKTLLTDLIDYAGLFPPAGLPMPEAAQEFNRQRLSDHAEGLNRFICPASRLEELSKHAAALMPGTFATSGYREMAGAGMTDPWDVSVIIDTELGQAIRAIDAFNERHAEEEGGRATVSAIELKASSSSDIDDALEGIPKEITPFFEIPTDDDPRGMIAALAGQDGVCAKIRCGGVKPEMIPPAEQVAGFVAACATAAVPFKATAGLHHPIRGEYPLTYDKNPPKAVMHGFINLVVGAAMIRKRLIDQPTLVELLEETHPKAFELTTDDAIVWRGVKLDLVSLADARERFFIGYGSCSYAEPIDDLRGLGWL